MERQNLHFSLLGDAPPTTQRSKLIAGMLCLGGALGFVAGRFTACLLYTSPSPRDS